MMPVEWWQDFFSGLWLQVQRQWRAERTPAEADFLEQVLALEPQANLLDVPCGEGRLSLALAARGYQVTGVDITGPLLEEARNKARERQLTVRWEQRDMRALPWSAEFDGAFCFWGSFGYFDELGNVEFVRAVSNALKPGGRFVIDTNVVESLLPNFQERGWNRVGDILVLEERNYRHEESRIEVEWTFVQAGKMEKKQISVRVYTYHELCRLLEAHGFGHLKGYSSLDREPFKLGQRVYLVATKESDIDR